MRRPTKRRISGGRVHFPGAALVGQRVIRVRLTLITLLCGTENACVFVGLFLRQAAGRVGSHIDVCRGSCHQGEMYVSVSTRVFSRRICVYNSVSDEVDYAMGTLSSQS